MKRIKKLRMKKRVTCVLAIFAMLTLETTAPSKLATNKLATNHLSSDCTWPVEIDWG